MLPKLFKRKPKQESDLSQSTQESQNNTSSLTVQSILGLKILHEPKVTSKVVDVIFIHGLGGSARETWTHPSSGIFWPDLLHENEKFANARISTFGYDANFDNIFAANSVLDISDFSKQLLDALDLHYDQYGDVSIYVSEVLLNQVINIVCCS